MNKILSPIHYGRAVKCRMIDMSKVSTSLEKVRAGLETPGSKINAKITNTKMMPLSNVEHDNLIHAYEYLNVLLKKPELDPEDILDINLKIRNGNTMSLDDHMSKPSYQKSFYKHIRQTWEWLSAKTQDADTSPYMIAAGLYTKVVNDSKLFTDGHQRTASILMAYVLAKADIEPFYLKEGSASKFFNLSDDIKTCGSMRPIKTIMLNRSRDQLAKFLMEHYHYHYTRYDHLF
jgi:hypothetical protein